MGDIVKTVDREEFEKLKKESLHVKQCPFCGGKIKLVMSFPDARADTVAFQCDACGYSLKGYMPTEHHTCGEMVGTFTTADCIGRAVLNLVYLWNSQVEYESSKQSSEKLKYQKCFKQKVVNANA